MRDEVSCVLIPLHALMRLQTQLYQWGLHNPWYMLIVTTHGWFVPLYKFVRLQATGIMIICQS